MKTLFNPGKKIKTVFAAVVTAASLLGMAPVTSAASDPIVVRARGVSGEEMLRLNVGGTVVASWRLSTSAQDYTYEGSADGGVLVEYTNDASGRDVVLDYVRINGEIRQAEDMDYNTSTYANGSCGGGSFSENMHCNGAIGFGETTDCFNGSCSASGGTSSGGSCSGYVGITFDDGPGAYTDTLIRTLKDNNLTPVTWFVQGQYINGNAASAQKLLDVGEIHNHSWNHPDMSAYSYNQVFDQVSRTSDAIMAAGAPAPSLLRPPYGADSPVIRQVASDLGLRFITWDVDSKDWEGASSAAIAANVSRVQNGQVILMHDHDYHTRTINAISTIASALRARGLCAGRIDHSTGRAVAPDGASSGGGTSTPEHCNCDWYGDPYPVCVGDSDWGWENGASCIGTEKCTSYGRSISCN